MLALGSRRVATTTAAALLLVAFAGAARARPPIWFRADYTRAELARMKYERELEIIERGRRAVHRMAAAASAPTTVRGDADAEANLRRLSQEMADEALGFGGSATEE
jgi:hypothetical protein